MPSGTDTESQFRFLIACIRHSTAGKVDFEKVSAECDIVSKGAAAKRYERLMKAHNITPGAGANGVKKEGKDSDDTKKPKARVTKKRKLEEVNDEESDVDEPIKEEVIVKGEVKNEDAIVKPEYPSNSLPNATPPQPLSSQPHPGSSSAETQPDNDDDDDVLFVSATDRRSITNGPVYAFDHRQSQTHLPMHGTQSFDYAANMTSPQQFTRPNMSLPPPPPPPPSPTTGTMAPPNLYPYGLTPSAWVFPHDSHGYH